MRERLKVDNAAAERAHASQAKAKIASSRTLCTPAPAMTAAAESARVRTTVLIQESACERVRELDGERERARAAHHTYNVVLSAAAAASG